ncbi:hypothetical protein ACFFMN_16145 [Planobispora siamensis]|uniref:Uncharacterized protein n=1 Tax=Planobispora siamensis TaxID=936338 RepID=A0A8J3SGH3_9ACTN|nr:hypothetical protein [Planobispora siamensis]GIH93848.1 hypothetical protein Psi01_44780 [Planobispora siamensis]
MTVIATFVLLINDHLLKHLWPGLVTGKLSDLAGLMVAPPLLALARVPALAAVIATGLGFTLVKTTQAGAEAASQAWTLLAGPSRVLADPTDLITLPALAAAWLIWRRCQSEQAVRRARTLIIVPIALIAVTATAPEGASRWSATTGVSVDGDAITVFFESDYDGPYVSRDGGQTWEVPPPRSTPVVYPRPRPRTQDCVPGEPAHCYRVDPPRLAVQESRDGGRTWSAAWQLSEGREDMLRRRYGPAGEHLWTGSQAIAVQKTAGGHVVVAANGSDGIAVRDESGAWQRLGASGDGFSPEAAESLRPSDVNLEPERTMGFFAGLLVFLAGVGAAFRSGKAAVVFAVIASALISAGFLMTLRGMGEPYLIVNLPSILGGACALLGLIFAVIAAMAVRPNGWTWLFLLVTPPATMLTVWSLFSGWTQGAPDDYSTAVWLSCLAVIIGVATTVTAGYRGRRPIARENSRLEIMTGGDPEDPA